MKGKNSVEEILRQAKLRNRRIGTFEEQQKARKDHNINMRKMNKEAREMGYGGGMAQVIKEFNKKKKMKGGLI